MGTYIRMDFASGRQIGIGASRPRGRSFVCCCAGVQILQLQSGACFVGGDSGGQAMAIARVRRPDPRGRGRSQWLIHKMVWCGFVGWPETTSTGYAELVAD